MPEGVRPYPRWDGPLAQGPLSGTVASDVFYRLTKTFWGQISLLVVALIAVFQIANDFSAAGDSHTMTDFVDFLNWLRWGVLVVAALVVTPTLLLDQRAGALELYLSRALTTTNYLVGKILASFLLCFGAIFLPALIYVGAAAFRFKTHPAGWALALPGAFLYALLLAALISGLALGLSAVARSSRAATLLLLGGFVILDLVVSNLLTSITRDDKLQILSPFAAWQQQSEWIFQGITSGAKFPLWWGVAEVAFLTIVGWFLLWWKHPRVRGEERGRA